MYIGLYHPIFSAHSSSDLSSFIQKDEGSDSSIIMADPFLSNQTCGKVLFREARFSRSGPSVIL